MGKPDPQRWQGLRETARASLEQRDYSSPPQGAGEVIGAESIPGVQVFARQIHQQRHRGFFGELARRDEPPLADLGLWPAQWATARMFGGSAKGFHIHPPFVPEGENAKDWLQKVFVTDGGDVALREYSREQWDVMFFVSGSVEMILVDERDGMPRESMRFFIDGDDQAGPHNVGVIIPPGVAHALRTASSADAVMVYGTSTVFDPDAEGRIESGLEQAPLPPEWQRYLEAEDGK